MRKQTKIVIEEKFNSVDSKERQQKLNEIMIDIILKSEFL